MKLLFVGDLHLYDKELSTTKSMRANNIVMLERLYNYLVENEDIKIVVFEGDIQHKTPNSKSVLYEMARWKHWIRKIGELMTERRPKLVMVGREDGKPEEMHPNPKTLFTLKGNHDYSTALKSNDPTVEYTFYDDLIFEGLLQNPQGFVFKDSGKLYYVQLNNYGEADTPVPEKIRDNPMMNVIKVFHDTIKNPQSEAWIDFTPPNELYLAEEVLVDCKVGISGHIHEPQGPIVVNTVNGKKSIYVQTGSMGRTSASENQMRDYGLSTVIDTTDGLRATEVRIPLIPTDEYFDWAKIMLNSQKSETAKERKNFSISLGDYKREFYDPKEDVKNMDIPEKVKENCVSVLTSLENDEISFK